jgi:hypothetical protein
MSAPGSNNQRAAPLILRNDELSTSREMSFARFLSQRRTLGAPAETSKIGDGEH